MVIILSSHSCLRTSAKASRKETHFFFRLCFFLFLSMAENRFRHFDT